jgi:hypothetical protein
VGVSISLVGKMPNAGFFSGVAGVRLRLGLPFLLAISVFGQCGGQSGNISYACDSLGLTSLKYQGTEYFDLAGYSRAVPITYGPTFSDGTQPGNGSRIATSGTTYTSVTFASNTAYAYRIRFDYSTPDANTLKITVTLSNLNSAAAIVSFKGPFPISLDMPKPYTVVQPGSGDPLSGSFGAYVVTPISSIGYFSANFTDTWYAQTASVYVNQPDAGHDRWNFGLSNTEQNGPVTSTTPIPPQSSKSLDLYVRFGPTDADPATMDAEALGALRSAVPPNVTWPDRRPIATWFLADHGHASASNPRGWFNNPTCDCTNQATFHTELQASLNQLLGVVNKLPVRPQAIVLWDMEGEQFSQVMTYVGNPPLLANLAPEMDAEMDAVAATLHSNGYRVGMTLRPQHFYSGATLPGSCTYNSNKDYTEFFLLTSGTSPSPSYNACVKGGVWTTSPGSINDQISYTDEASVLAELTSKVNYANKRWGATVFYVDTTVWSGGAPFLYQLWQQLGAQFPNCLFLPEEKTDMTYAFTAPYADAHQSNFWSSAAHRFLYPTAFAAINLGNTNQSEAAAGFADVNGRSVTLVSGASFATGSSWSGQTIYLDGIAYTIQSVISAGKLALTSPGPHKSGAIWRVGVLAGLIKTGMASGDVYLYPAWFTDWQQAAASALWQEANYITIVTDTSTGKVHSFGANPGASYTVPLKMTVTFANTSDELTTSTVTCAGGATCSIDLSQFEMFQISYFDLAGKLVAQDPPSCVGQCVGPLGRRPRPF